MAGLYDSPIGALDPRSMMLLQMGSGLMSGPSMTPISLGQSIGKAGMQGLQAYQQAQQANQQAQLYQMKVDEAKRQEAERAKVEAAKAELMKNPEFAKLAPFIQAGLPMTAALDHVMPKPTERKPMVVGKSLVDPATREVLYTDPDKPKGPQSDLGKLKADMDAGLITPQEYQQKYAKLTTHAPAPSARVELKQETEFGKKVGGELGEMYSGLLRADMNAPATIGKYERLGTMLKEAGSGKFKGTTTEIKAAAKGLGIDLNALGVRDDVAPAQAARALANQLALELRNPAGGAGMPGALSDKDREFLVQSIPGLENDPKGNEKMIEYRTKLARREQQVARMARDYRRKNGKFDEGFFDELQQWSEKNPLFPELPSTPASGEWKIRPKGN